MSLSAIARKLDLQDREDLLRNAAELRRLCDVQYGGSTVGIGEVCKALLCLEMAASKLQVMFDRKEATRLSGLSATGYARCFNSLQKSLGVKSSLGIRELGIQFGCIRLIPLVSKSLLLFKNRYIASLPLSRRSGADIDRPVFMAVAFYLCAKKHKLKVDRSKLMQVCGASESEFKCISASMKELCSDVFEVSIERKNAAGAGANKRKNEDEGSSDDSSSKRRRK